MNEIVFVALFSLAAAQVLAQDNGVSFDSPELTAQIADNYAIYSMIASNS